MIANSFGYGNIGKRKGAGKGSSRNFYRLIGSIGPRKPNAIEVVK